MALRKVGRERDRAFRLADGCLMPPQVEERNPQHPVSVGIALGKRDRLPRMLLRLLQRLRGRGDPSVHMVHPMREGQERIGRDEARIEVDGPFQQLLRLNVRFLSEQPDLVAAAQKAVMGLEIVGVLARQSLLVFLRQVERQRADDVLRHVVLDSEDVGELAIETLCPKVPAGAGVDQLGGDADAVAGLFGTLPSRT